MTSSRRLPTVLLIAIAAAVLGAGGLWWERAAPAPTTTAAEQPDTVIIRLDNGAALTYHYDRSAAGTAARFADLNRLVSLQWPCRSGPPQGRRPPLRRGFDLVDTPDTAIRLPRCTAPGTGATR